MIPETSPSHRHLLTSLLAGFGVVSLILVLLAGEIFSQVVLDHRKDAVERTVGLIVEARMDELREKLHDIGQALQHDPQFRRHYRDRNMAALVATLNSHFHQYYVSSGAVHLEKIYIFDADLNLVAQSSLPTSLRRSNQLACATLIRDARPRQGAARLRPLNRLCLYNEQLLMGTLVPIGGLEVRGYAAVIARPIYNIAKAESILGMPLRIASIHGEDRYLSRDWPTQNNHSDSLTASYLIRTETGQGALIVNAVNDIETLNQRLFMLRILTILATVIATVAMIAYGTRRFRATFLQPLGELQRHIHDLRKDHRLLGKELILHGSAEVLTLADEFQALSWELKTLCDHLGASALSDTLTQLPNRTLFIDRLQQLIFQGERRPERFAVMVVDVTQRHEGDTSCERHIRELLLIETAKRLRQTLRKADTLARFGDDPPSCPVGDRFALILPAVHTSETAEIVAIRLQQAFQAPFVVQSRSFDIDVHIGIALFPLHGNTAQQLLHHADTAANQARQGRQSHILYQHRDYDTALSTASLAGELRRALKMDHFVLFFQPVIDLHSRRPVHAEVSVRWNHSKRGLLHPAHFLPVAEQSGLLQPLCEWVLENTLAQCTVWRAQGFELPVSIALSARHFHDPGTIQHLSDLLAACQTETPPLYLEVPEKSLLADPDRTTTVIHDYARRNVRVYLSNFGTGFISLALLRRLPLAGFKIAERHVQAALANEASRFVVNTAAALAQNLGMNCVATGIDTEETLACVRSSGCRFGQGTLFCGPVPDESLRKWAEHQHEPSVRTPEPC